MPWNTQRERIKLSFGHVQINHLQIGDLLEADRAMVDLLKDDHAIIQNYGQMRKNRYDGSLHKIDKIKFGVKVVWRTADGEKYSERLIFGSVKLLILFENQNIGFCW